jgi:enamine deaminase RidA (YjgF/YER057c/UK114 family)
MSEPHEVVNPQELADPVGFSHAIVAQPGTVVYLAGQTALNAEGRIEGQTMAEQFDRAAANLVTALGAAGGSPEHIVSVQVFVTDMAAYKSQLEEIGAAYRARFGRNYPAMALLGVRELWDHEATVEIMGIAVLPEGESR